MLFPTFAKSRHDGHTSDKTTIARSSQWQSVSNAIMGPTYPAKSTFLVVALSALTLYEMHLIMRSRHNTPRRAGRGYGKSAKTERKDGEILCIANPCGGTG